MKRISGKKQVKPVRKLRLKERYLVLGVLILLVCAGIVLSIAISRASSRVFRVKEILVTGNRHLSDSEIRTMAGVKMGDGLLTVSKKKVSERMLRSPWVKAASVRKDFPDRLMIRIYEATPFAILDKKGQSFLIDEKGGILEKMNEDPVPFLPVITADPEKMRENFVEAIRLAGVIKDKKIATERGRVEIVANGKGPEDLAVIVDSVVIKIGFGDYEQKLERLFALDGEIKKRAVSVDYVDLRFANRVVVKPMNEVIR
ncbi:MAG TPA: FtsQ-type POTRA domain-containing protein [Thermodesulfovibrionales bacterium]|nr:FtsQ-type POTRA domain-containing protein [Thermodesulfovibrionales bacterium]